MLLALIAIIAIFFLAPKVIKFLIGLAVFAILWKVFKGAFKIALVLIILLIIVKMA